MEIPLLSSIVESSFYKRNHNIISNILWSIVDAHIQNTQIESEYLKNLTFKRTPCKLLYNNG